MAAVTVLSVGLAAPATAGKMNADELLDFCRKGAGTFIETPTTYSCELPSGTFIHCESNTTKECDVSAPPGVSEPIPGVAPKPEDNAPDEPVQVTPGPIVLPDNGNVS